ncbi:MAG: hypothetical protein QXW80_03955 [Candidatus Micrarchaeia archaeon]
MMMRMPMVYISKDTLKILNAVVEYLQKNTGPPSRILKADVIHAALEEYAKIIGIKVK